MPKYVVLPEAAEDLTRIGRFTAEKWGVRQAERYLSTLQATFRLLAERPSAGRDRSDDIGAGYMSFVQGSHVIYFKKTDNGVAIAAILHQSMIPQKHLLPKSSAENRS